MSDDESYTDSCRNRWTRGQPIQASSRVTASPRCIVGRVPFAGWRYNACAWTARARACVGSGGCGPAFSYRSAGGSGKGNRCSRHVTRDRPMARCPGPRERHSAHGRYLCTTTATAIVLHFQCRFCINAILNKISIFEKLCPHGIISKYVHFVSVARPDRHEKFFRSRLAYWSSVPPQTAPN